MVRIWSVSEGRLKVAQALAANDAGYIRTTSSNPRFIDEIKAICGSDLNYEVEDYGDEIRISHIIGRRRYLILNLQFEGTE